MYKLNSIIFEDDTNNKANGILDALIVTFKFMGCFHTVLNDLDI